MHRLALTAALALTLCAGPALAHHAAEGIVDEEIYTMIDALVEGTPHAEMTLDDLGGRMAEATIVAPSVVELEQMIADGLFEYLEMLEGVVTVNLVFNPDGSVSMVITQVADPVAVQDGAR